MAAFVTQPAPDFKADALVNGEFKQVSLSDYKGKKIVLFFYPLDFTFVCPTEILAFADSLKEFEARNTQVIGVSVDSKFSHHAWVNTPRKEGGIQGVTFPLVSDLNKTIAQDYNVLLPAGIALRGVGLQDLAQADAKPNEAAKYRASAQARFQDAIPQFSTAITAFLSKVETPIEKDSCDATVHGLGRDCHSSFPFRIGRFCEVNLP